MASTIPIDGSWLRGSPFESQNLDARTIILTLGAVIVTSLVAAALLGLGEPGHPSNAELINPPRWYETTMQKRVAFFKDGYQLFNDARKKYGSKPFSMLTGNGTITILPNSLAHDIRNIAPLSFRTATYSDLHGDLRGFETTKLVDQPDLMLQNLVKKHLTKRLNTVTEPLAKEATLAVRLTYGDSPEWREIKFHKSALDVIARLSSRIFLGEELCRNEEWLEITKSHTEIFFIAAIKLHMIPRALRPLVNMFHPDCRKNREMLAKGTKLVEGLVVERRRKGEECRAAGLPKPVFNDAIDWADDVSGGRPFDATGMQLFLSMAAIHTTSDLASQTMLHLANTPENIPVLRQEIISVLKEHGWKKTALVSMKLVDSAIKEAQRLKPIQIISMIRKAKEDVVLPDGTKVRKGQRLAVDNSPRISEQVYENPEKYDMYRFRRMRDEPGGEHKAQLVSTTPEHLAFGHGLHACPGRFFAANEIKIILAHLLLKYDWELAPGTTTDPTPIGYDLNINQEARLRFRRRQEEIDLDSLEMDDSE